MIWDYTEANPFSNSSGNISSGIDQAKKMLENIYANNPGEVYQRDASSSLLNINSTIISTDPPYYDNICYADLSDFFYVWLRRSLNSIYPDIFSTLLTPKNQELIPSKIAMMEIF